MAASNNTNNNNTLFLVGGTGRLGIEIAKGLVTVTGYDGCKAIVRDISKAAELEALGWTLIEVPNYKNEAALVEALAGARTIVSTFGGSEMTSLEIATIAAAKQVGASLFVPSQFGIDYRRWSKTFPFLVAKRTVLEAAATQGLPTLCVFVGLFSDIIFNFLADAAHGKATIVGDGTANISFTRRSDIGYVLAKALSDKNVVEMTGGFLSMHGETMPWKDALMVVEQSFGKPLEIEYVDPEEASKQEQELLTKGLAGDMGAFYGSFVFHLLGEPARGYTGLDVSAEANHYGYELEKLQVTCDEFYSPK